MAAWVYFWQFQTSILKWWLNNSEIIPRTWNFKPLRPNSGPIYLKQIAISKQQQRLEMLLLSLANLWPNLLNIIGLTYALQWFSHGIDKSERHLKAQLHNKQLQPWLTIQKLPKNRFINFFPDQLIPERIPRLHFSDWLVLKKYWGKSFKPKLS